MVFKLHHKHTMHNMHVCAKNHVTYRSKKREYFECKGVGDAGVILQKNKNKNTTSFSQSEGEIPCLSVYKSFIMQMRLLKCLFILKNINK